MKLTQLAIIGGALWFATRPQQSRKDDLSTKLKLWADSIALRNPQLTTSLYSDDAVLLATFDEQIAIGKDAILAYFEKIFQNDGLECILTYVHAQSQFNVVSGYYTFVVDGKEQKSRFSFVFGKDGKIVNHHSSLVPA